MKNINSLLFLIFVFVLSNSLLSCTSKKIGFFRNTYPQYSVKEKPRGNSSSEKVVAGMENKVSGRTNQDLINKKENVKHSQSSSLVESKDASLNLTDNTAQKLTKEERKQVRKDIIKSLKQSKNNDSSVATLLLVIIAILLPPLAVALVDGLTGPFWLSILLTLLFYLPGLIYALFRIFRTDTE